VRAEQVEDVREDFVHRTSATNELRCSQPDVMQFTPHS
jgi:hypothetical protein